MRNYALNRAIAAESAGASLITLYRNWQARRGLARLENCDDHMLRDIGIARDDLRWAMRLPLRRNPMLALEDRAFRLSRA